MNVERGFSRKDCIFLGLLWALLACLHAPVLFGGQVYFTNDLTHISHPWRVLVSEQLQKGQVPLWNPYTCFGLPLLGNMQSGVFYPLSVLFYIFPFSSAMGWFLFLHYALGGLWAFLWLRRLKFGPVPCLTGASVFALGGYLVGHLQFTNLIGTLVHLPALFLFAGHVLPLALLAAMAFLSGYLPIWVGMALCLILLSGLWPWGERPPLLRSALGLGLGLVLSAQVLLPGVELIRMSSRGGGLKAEEQILDMSFRPEELLAFIHPEWARKLSFRRQIPHPQRQDVSWEKDGRRKQFTFYSKYIETMKDPSGIKYVPWKSCYLGFVGFMLLCVGAISLARQSPMRTAGLTVFVLGVVLLISANQNALSAWLWTHLFPLRYVRGPARLSYLALAVFIPLVAAGTQVLTKMKWGGIFAPLAALGVLLELSGLAWGYYPTLPKSYYAEKGALVEFLSAHLKGQRYYQLPLVELWAYVDKEDPSKEYQAFKEMIFRSYKQKLFGVSNAVFHFSAASGAYEPLIPAPSQGVMDFIRQAETKDQKEMAPYLRWGGIRYLLDRMPRKGPPFIDRGLRLWHVHEVPGPISRAYWLPPESEKFLTKDFASAPHSASPLDEAWAHQRPREDRVEIQGIAQEPGLLYLAEPFYPGWKAYINGKKAAAHRALDAFTYIPVPAGEVRALCIYSPDAWKIGCALGLLAWLFFAYAGWKAWHDVIT